MFKFLSDLYYRLRGTHSAAAIMANFTKHADNLDSLADRHETNSADLDQQADAAYQRFASLSDASNDASAAATDARRLANKIRSFAS